MQQAHPVVGMLRIYLNKTDHRDYTVFDPASVTWNKHGLWEVRALAHFNGNSNPVDGSPLVISYNQGTREIALEIVSEKWTLGSQGGIKILADGTDRKFTFAVTKALPSPGGYSLEEYSFLSMICDEQTPAVTERPTDS